MEAKSRNSNNNSRSTNTSYSQPYLKTINQTKNSPQDSLPLSHTYFPNSSIENESFQNQINFRNQAFNPNMTSSYNLGQYSPQFNAVNAPNPYYYIQTQQIPNNQFKGENYHPNLENRINNKKNIYINNPGTINYQNQLINIYNTLSRMKEGFEYKIANMKKEISDQEKTMKDMKKEMSEQEKKMKDMSKDHEKKMKDMSEDHEKKMKDMKEDYEYKINSLKKNINNKIENVEDGLKQIKTTIEQLKINSDLDCSIENTYFEATKKVIDLLNIMVKNGEEIKDYFEKEIQNKTVEINQLKKQISDLKENINMLQVILIGRKLMKIILKKICDHCFQTIDISSNKKYIQIINVTCKEKKYSKMIDIANRILKALYETNHIIHIDGEINQIINIINSKTTYGQILEICKKSLFKKNDADIIRNLFNEKNIYNIICKEEIIDKDKELKELLNNYIGNAVNKI